MLSHGDGSQLLGDLSPSAAWLPALVEKRVFDRGVTTPGEWIATHIDDPDMIRACAGLAFIDDHTRSHISRALEREKETLAPLRAKAWRTILSAKQSQNTFPEDAWYLSVSSGKADFEMRNLVAQLLRPRLDIKKALRFGVTGTTVDEQETLHQLLQLNFVLAAEDPTPAEILNAWPGNLPAEVALFTCWTDLSLEALEEAEDISGPETSDRVSHDVPSIAEHQQNSFRSGFYSIIRLLADLWLRIASRNSACARDLALPWTTSKFLLSRRLFLFALREPVFPAEEVRAALQDLDDRIFWASNAQVEIMGLLVHRWKSLSATDRSAIEARLSGGVPRGLYRGDSSDNDHWNSVSDLSIYPRLKRIELAGGELRAEVKELLSEIAKRHPEWKPSPGDRDDFQSWSETRVSDLAVMPSS